LELLHIVMSQKEQIHEVMIAVIAHGFFILNCPIISLHIPGYVRCFPLNITVHNYHSCFIFRRCSILLPEIYRRKDIPVTNERQAWWTEYFNALLGGRGRNKQTKKTWKFVLPSNTLVYTCSTNFWTVNMGHESIGYEECDTFIYKQASALNGNMFRSLGIPL